MTALLIGIFSCIGVWTGFISAKRYKYNKITRGQFVFLSIFSFCLILLGIAFIYHEHYIKYGFLHIMNIIISFTMPFVFMIFIPDRIKQYKEHNAVIYAMTAVVAFFTIFKFTYINSYGMPLYHTLPLNVCNIVAVFIIIRPFWKNKLFDNYILCFGLLGGLMNIILGTRYGFDQNFYTDIVYESNIIHNLFITYSLYMFLSGEIKPDYRKSFKNMIWLIPVFSVFVFTNQIYEYNFFFTSKYENPILGIYNMFPVFNITVFHTAFEINLIYYIIVIAASFGVLGLLARSLQVVSKKISR